MSLEERPHGRIRVDRIRLRAEHAGVPRGKGWSARPLVSLADDGVQIDHPGPGFNVTVTIDVIEFLGNDVLIHGSSGGRDVVAIVDVDNTLKVGDSVVLSGAPRRLHVFNPVSLVRMIGTG